MIAAELAEQVQLRSDQTKWVLVKQRMLKSRAR